MLKRYIVALLTGLLPNVAGHAQVILLNKAVDYPKRNELNSITSMRKSILLTIVTLLLWSFGFLEVQAQPGPPEATHKVQTGFIYNFTKYIHWPDAYNAGNFTIGVLGDTQLNDELARMAATKTANGRKIVVRSYKDVREIDKMCHILFIAADKNDLLNAVLQKTTGTSTLVVTEKDGAARFGSLINFVSDKGKPGFEMNLSAFERSHLKFDSKLKSAAIAI